MAKGERRGRDGAGGTREISPARKYSLGLFCLRVHGERTKEPTGDTSSDSADYFFPAFSLARRGISDRVTIAGII